MKTILGELEKFSSPQKAKILAGFFKTGKGQYGEGDIFIGVTVPNIRSVANTHAHISLGQIKDAVFSRIHEERLCGLLILVEQFKKADEKGKKEIFEFYMKNTKRVNNWDLVDLTADKIAGEYLQDKEKGVLYELAKSENIWERRIAIISTFAFIKKGKFRDTFKIAKILLNDRHDLIQKAAGWMLREVGKRVGEETEEKFLKKHYRQMPRTMLRYAIERFPEIKKKAYMKGTA